MRISNSFSEGELQVLEFILQTLLRGGSPHLATRNKDFASVYRKVMTMQKRIAEKKAKATADDAPAESSVGLIDAPAEEVDNVVGIKAG